MVPREGDASRSEAARLASRGGSRRAPRILLGLRVEAQEEAIDGALRAVLLVAVPLLESAHERFTLARDDVEVFVVDVSDISKYARITQGVSVSRTPALVVVRPRKLTGSVPVATVSYGFRGPRSINQAVDDAVYEGKQVPSYP